MNSPVKKSVKKKKTTKKSVRKKKETTPDKDVVEQAPEPVVAKEPPHPELVRVLKECPAGCMIRVRSVDDEVALYRLMNAGKREDMRPVKVCPRLQCVANWRTPGDA